MAASADPPSSHHFPRGSDPSAGSPRSRRKNLPSPRSQASCLDAEATSPCPSPPPLRSAAEAERAPGSPRRPAPQPEGGSEESPDWSGGNVVSVQPRKPAWNKPSSEAVDAGPVMGDAVSWPALSESARASPKSPSVDASSSKAVPVESVSISQARVEIPSGPPVMHSPQKQAASNSLNANSTSNNSPTARQKINRRGGGGNSNFPNAYGQGGFAHRPIPPPPPPPLPQFPIFQMASNPYGNFIPQMANAAVRDPTYKGNNWDGRPVRGFVSPPHVMTDHRNSSRRGNSGPHHRGDGSPRNGNNNGTRRDRDRGNFSGARDVNVHAHRANPRGFVRSSPPPPTSPQFVGPPPVRPLVPMSFPDISPHFYIPALPVEPYSGGPFFPPPPSTPMFMPVSDPSLPSHIVRQIEYYFSDDNLVKDEFLKSNMDTEGWVPISLIATFRRVTNLTNSIQLILESLRDSTVVEVQDNKVRRRNEWAKWIYRGSPASRSSSYEELAASFEKMTAQEIPANQNDTTGEADVHRDAVPRYSPKSTDQAQHPDTVGTDC